jgi:candicidin polyketide synthase FscB
MVRGLLHAPARRSATNARGGVTFAERLAGQSAQEQQRLLQDLVFRQTEAVLGRRTADRFDGDRGFVDLGMTSLMGVELRNGLAAELGVRLPATLIYDHSTANALVRYLGTEVGIGPVSDGPPVVGELDRVVAMIAATELDARTRAGLVKRLATLQWQLESVAPDGDAGGLDGASDDEMFALINRELGID